MKLAELVNRTIAYQDHGKGEVLLLAHAFPLNQSMWEEQITHFSRTRRVIAFDWRGFGRSSGAGHSISMEDLADDLAELIVHLDLEKLSLCALSMGGYAAFGFHRKYPELFAARVSSLILADTKATIEDEQGRAGRLSMAQKAELEGSRSIAEIVVPKLVSQSTLQNDPELVDLIKEMVAGTPPASIAAAQRGMAVRPDSTSELPDIKCPTLVIVGSEDQLTPPGEAEAMTRMLPNARLTVIDGAGHLTNLERPERFNEAVERWSR